MFRRISWVSLSFFGIALGLHRASADHSDGKGKGGRTIEVTSSQGFKTLKAEILPNGHGSVLITGQFDRIKGEDERTNVYIEAYHPRIGRVGSAHGILVFSENKGSFTGRLGTGSDFRYLVGGFDVSVTLAVGKKIRGQEKIHFSESETPFLAAANGGKAVPSSIKFDTDPKSPTSGKTGMTYWIRGQGSYDSGINDFGNPCATASVILKAKNTKTLKLDSSSAVFDKNIWTGQIAGLVPGDYEVWAEQIVVGHAFGCVDSATATVKLTIAP